MQLVFICPRFPSKVPDLVVNQAGQAGQDGNQVRVSLFIAACNVIRFYFKLLTTLTFETVGKLP